MSIEGGKLDAESVDTTKLNVDTLQPQMKEKLKNIFPDSSELPVTEFAGSYEDFLKNWVPCSACENQFLAIAIKNIGMDRKEIESFVEVLKENNIYIKDTTEFIDNYVFGWDDVIMPMMLSQIMEGNHKQYIYLSGEFMFNKIKKYLQQFSKKGGSLTSTWMPDPRIETLKKIAKGLNVSVDDLIK